MLVIRFLLGLGLVAYVSITGFLHRPVQVLALQTVLFTTTYILGKWHLWKPVFERTYFPVKEIVVTATIQAFVVAMFYFVGAGLGWLFGVEAAPTQLAVADWLVWGCVALSSVLGSVTLIVSGDVGGRRLAEQVQEIEEILNRAETADPIDQNRSQTLATNAETEPELDIDDTPVKIDETFFHSRHFNVNDYSYSAISESDRRWERIPKVATDALLDFHENRLGVTFPASFRDLYKIQNGGNLPTYWIPLKTDPQPTFDDWYGAFAHDYDDIRPLHALELLSENYTDTYEPDEDPEPEDWQPGCDKMIILTHRYDNCTLLDCNPSTAPRVLITEMAKPVGERIIAEYPTFEAFLGALRKTKEETESKLGQRAYTHYTADSQLWAWTTNSATSGASQAQINEFKARNGVKFPAALAERYSISNGGQVAFFSDSTGDGTKLIPKSMLHPIENLVTLPEFVRRIEPLPFDENASSSSWENGFDDPQKLVVVSASFETLLMLDYRSSPDNPSVLWIADMDRGSCSERKTFNNPEEFLASLCRVEAECFNNNLLGDPTLSPIAPTPQTFWARDEQISGASDEEVAAFTERVGFDIPDSIVELFKVQNGGKVHFRYLPPQRAVSFQYRANVCGSENWLPSLPEALPPLNQIKSVKESNRLLPEIIDVENAVILGESSTRCFALGDINRTSSLIAWNPSDPELALTIHSVAYQNWKGLRSKRLEIT